MIALYNLGGATRSAVQVPVDAVLSDAPPLVYV